MEVQGIIRLNSRNYVSITDIVIKLKSVIFGNQADKSAEYFQRQVYFKNLPEVFEIVASDYFFRNQKIIEATR